MNLINRVVIILLILAAMLIIPLIFVFPEQAEFLLRYIADVIAANLTWLDGLSPAAQIGVRILLAGVGVVVLIIGLVFLALEVIRIQRRTVQLRNKSGKVVMDGVSEHLAYYIDLLADIVRVRPKIASKGKNVRVELYVETGPGVHIPSKTAEIQKTAQRVIEEQLGLELSGDVKVVIKPATIPKGTPGIVAHSEPEWVEKAETFAPPLQVGAEETKLVEVKSPAEDVAVD